MIHFQCPECQAAIEAPDDHAGRSARCPTCSRRLRVPAKSRGDDRTEHELLADASATSSAVFRMDGRLYQARPRLEGTLIAAAAVVALSLGMFVAVGLTINVYSPWAAAGLVAAVFALFGALLVVPALYNIRRSGGRKTGRRLAMMTVAAALGLTGAYGTVSLSAKVLADVSPCYYRLQAVHRALVEYAGNNGGAFPARPEELVEQGYLGASKLTCREEPWVREGTPTYLRGSYDPRIDMKKQVPFPGDVMVLMERYPHRIVDQSSGGEVLGWYALQLDGTVSYVAALEDREKDEARLVEALKLRDGIVTRVLAERETERKQREMDEAAGQADEAAPRSEDEAAETGPESDVRSEETPSPAVP